MTLIVGSYAARQHIPNFREPQDIDAFSESFDGLNGLRPDLFWHPSLAGLFEGERIATLDELYTIKISHLFWDVAWDKHAADAILFSRNGAKFDRGLYDILLPIWKEEYGTKITSVTGSKDDFFSDAVVRIYDHDSIHDTVAYYDAPLYESLLIGEVEMDMSIFWNDMSHEDQIRLVREEVYATALERTVIPSGYTVSPSLAYHRALKKTLTSLTKGDFALFIALNLDELFRPDINYVERHKQNANLLVELEK